MTRTELTARLRAAGIHFTEVADGRGTAVDVAFADLRTAAQKRVAAMLNAALGWRDAETNSRGFLYRVK